MPWPCRLRGNRLRRALSGVEIHHPMATSGDRRRGKSVGKAMDCRDYTSVNLLLLNSLFLAVHRGPSSEHEWSASNGRDVIGLLRVSRAGIRSAGVKSLRMVDAPFRYMR